MAEFDKNINLHIQEAKLGRIKAKGPTSKHNKLNAERQKENLESSKGKITSYIQQNPSKINSWFLIRNHEGKKTEGERGKRCI